MWWYYCYCCYVWSLYVGVLEIEIGVVVLWFLICFNVEIEICVNFDFSGYIDVCVVVVFVFSGVVICEIFESGVKCFMNWSFDYVRCGNFCCEGIGGF